MNITEISYHNTEDKNQATAGKLNNMTGIYFDEKMKPVKPGKYAQQAQEIENVMNLTMNYLRKSSDSILNKENEMNHQVTQLSSYGQAFDHMPLKAQILQMKVMFSELQNKFGWVGTLRFIGNIIRTQNQLKKKYGETIKTQFADVPTSAITELYTMTAMYLALAEMEDKEQAYEFVKGIFQKIGPTAHETLYNVQGLLQCEGDVFTNFCQLNRSIFESSARKGFYDITELQDTENLQFIKLTKCLNVNAFSTLGCPELARLGCDIDIAGYAPEAMGNKVQLDFRRPCTIAKGAEACEFYYYRQGHAPADMTTV